MEDSLVKKKLELEIDLIKVQLDNLEKNNSVQKKNRIDWSIFIPLTTAIVGAIATLLIGLENTRSSVEQKRIEQETKIVEWAIDPLKFENKATALVFFNEIGLLKIENLEERLSNKTIVIPSQMPELDRQYLESSRKILLVDNRERFYGGPSSKGKSNADHIWIALKEKSKFKPKLVNLVIDKNWNEKDKQLTDLVKKLNPELIVMHLSTFCHKRTGNCQNESETLIPFLDEILDFNRNTKILLYSRKDKGAIERILVEIQKKYPNRTEFVMIKDGKGFDDSEENIPLLEDKIESLISK